MSGLQFPKPSRGDGLRAKHTRVLRAKRTLTELYRKVYARDGYRCVACRRAVQPNTMDELQRAHPHHIVPRSLAVKAVKHTSRNVVTLCPFAMPTSLSTASGLSAMRTSG